MLFVGSDLGISWSRSNSQSLVKGVRLPVSTVVSSCVTVTVVASNVTAQPASHICPMETSGFDFKAGKMCVCLAAWGSDMSGKSHS